MAICCHFRRLIVAIVLLLTGVAAGQTEPKWPLPVEGWVAPQPGEHPRLFFRKSDVPALRQRAQTPEGKAILARLRLLLGHDGEAMPSAYSKSIKPYDNASPDLPVGAFTLTHGAGFGFLYQITGERKYADLGRQCVEKAFEGIPDRDDRYGWKHPGGLLRAGPSLAYIAMAYDLCYDGWDEDFRIKVAKAIQDYGGDGGEWNKKEELTLDRLALRPKHHPVSNHWGAEVGGAGVAILAILGDPGTDGERLERYLASVRKNAIRGLREGYGDHAWFAESHGPSQLSANTGFVPYLQAERIAGGQDFITTNPRAQYLTMRWAMEMISKDGRPYYPCRHPSSYGTEKFFENRSGQSHGGHFSQGFGAIRDDQKAALLWSYNTFVEPPGTEYTYDAITYPHRAVLAFVNWPIGIEPENPETVLPRVLQDKQKGYYVFRNRWQDENDIIITALLGTEPDKAYSKVGAEEVMVWGLGLRTRAPGVFNRNRTTYFKAEADGSGVVSGVPIKGDEKQVTSLAVDFSGRSGADALVVMVGATAGTKEAQLAPPTAEEIAQAPAIEPPAQFEVRQGVPVVSFVPGRTPDQWLHAGPLKTPDRDGDLDLLAPLGGRADAAIAPGAKVLHGGAEVVFEPLHAGYIRRYKRAVGGGKQKQLVDDVMVNILDAAGRREFDATRFLYTVLDVERETPVRVAMGHPDQRLWLGGREVMEGQVLRLRPGRIPMLAEFAIGKKTLVETVVRLDPVEPAAAAPANPVADDDRPSAHTAAVRAGAHTYHILTLQRGPAPRIITAPDNIRIGQRVIRFDGEKLILDHN